MRGIRVDQRVGLEKIRVCEVDVEAYTKGPKEVKTQWNPIHEACSRWEVFAWPFSLTRSYDDNISTLTQDQYVFEIAGKRSPYHASKHSQSNGSPAGIS